VQAELLLRYDFTGQDTNSLAIANEGGSGPGALISGSVPLVAAGMTGEDGDFAFDGTGAGGGGAGYSYSKIDYQTTNGCLIGPLKSFTITGWFKADYGLSNSCCLLHAVGADSDNLTFAVNDDSAILAVNAGGPSTQAVAVRNPYREAGVWTFFAVTYDPSQAANEVVTFYKGTSKDALEVITTGEDVIHGNGWAGMGADGVLSFGAAVNGNRPVDALLDDVRLYGDSVGTAGVLSFEELDAVRKTKGLMVRNEAASSSPVYSIQPSAFRLPSIFSDHMVLQRERPVPVWGSAEAGSNVTVEFAGQVKTATADDDGKWRVDLDPMPASSKPQILTVSCNRQSEIINRKFSDVLVGEVWYCSGQSNMDFPIKKTENAAAVMAAADYPLIRLLNTPRQIAGEPTDILSAQWEVCSPETVGSCSGVAYYFGLKIFQDLNVPVGLFKSAWGGTRIEPWIPACGYATEESLAKHYQIALNASEMDLTAKGAIKIPSVLHNGMVAGHIPYAIRGVIWYQGESNRFDRENYIAKTRALLNGWYELWGYEFPFLFVQIAPFEYWHNKPKNLPGFWEIQTEISRTVSNTWMTVVNDAATLDDIHPPNKEVPGSRLALLAEANVYGMDVDCFGPVFQSLEKNDDRLTVQFDYSEGLTTRDGEAPDWFEIAGTNGVFCSATAAISNGAVVLYAADVADPVSIRFAWDELAMPNLMNGAGLPTSAFRADVR
jgi:hypothetical protein